jgi:hypothetical protein
MKRRTLKLIGLGVFILLIVWSALSWRSRRHFNRSLFESLASASRELALGETSVVAVENTLKAEFCVICPGYANRRYVYSQVRELGIDERVAGKIAGAVGPYDTDYMLLIRSDRVVFRADLASHALPSVYLPDSKTVVGDHQNMLASRVGKKIRLTVKKVGNETPLLIEKID